MRPSLARGQHIALLCTMNEWSCELSRFKKAEIRGFAKKCNMQDLRLLFALYF